MHVQILLHHLPARMSWLSLIAPPDSDKNKELLNTLPIFNHDLEEIRVTGALSKETLLFKRRLEPSATSSNFLDRDPDGLAKMASGRTSVRFRHVGAGQSCTNFASGHAGQYSFSGNVSILELRCFHDSARLGGLGCSGLSGFPSGASGATHRLHPQGPSRER